ncbi:MAG: hypothetical protein SFZ02_19835 [bacterium]|nr:hypothetical protein [bacterium]
MDEQNELLAGISPKNLHGNVLFPDINRSAKYRHRTHPEKNAVNSAEAVVANWYKFGIFSQTKLT